MNAEYYECNGVNLCVVEWLMIELYNTSFYARDKNWMLSQIQNSSCMLHIDWTTQTYLFSWDSV